MKEIINMNTGEVDDHESFQGDCMITESSNEKYLGQIISNNGTNAANVKNRSNKGSGMTNTIESIMKNVPVGRFHFKIAIVLRNSYLISSMLSCSEVWYNVTEAELRKLEQTDEKLLCKILNCSSQVTNEMLYLELGILPIRFIIKLRRLLYFQHILQQIFNNSLIYNFLIAQMKEPRTNDWASTVQSDLNELNMELSLAQIGSMNTQTFKDICRKNIVKKTFEYLEAKKMKHDKVKYINYNGLEMASYLKATSIELSIREKQFLFQC